MVFMRFLAIQLLDCDVFILNVAERFLCRTDYFNWPVFDGDMIKKHGLKSCFHVMTKKSIE
jgi:hypothetical protein